MGFLNSYNNFKFQKLSNRKVILGIIIFTISLFLLLALLFNVIKYTYTMYSIEIVSFSGFDVLDAKVDKSSVSLDKYAFATCIIMVVSSAIMMFLSILNTIFLKEDKFYKVNIFFICLAFVEMVMFLITGILYVDELGSGASTVAYAPLIILVVLIIAYIIVYFALDYKKPVRLAENQSSNIESKNYQMQKEDIELLVSYKQLLDSGIITQEEFDEKKSKILK